MTDAADDTELNAKHNAKMAKIQAARAKIMADRQIEKGLLIVHTGTGKGKTTAALGMVCRAIGHGQRVAVIQFVKGALKTGEKVSVSFDMSGNNHEAKTVKLLR